MKLTHQVRNQRLCTRNNVEGEEPEPCRHGQRCISMFSLQFQYCQANFLEVIVASNTLRAAGVDVGKLKLAPAKFKRLEWLGKTLRVLPERPPQQFEILGKVVACVPHPSIPFTMTGTRGGVEGQGTKDKGQETKALKHAGTRHYGYVLTSLSQDWAVGPTSQPASPLLEADHRMRPLWDG